MIINNLLLKKNLAPKTVTDIHSRLKSIYKYALIHGYSAGYLPECVSVPQDKDEIRVLSIAEEETLLSYINEHPDLTTLGILICLFIGSHIRELYALMWSDIFLSEQELSVKRTMQRLKNLNPNAEKKTYISSDEPKSKCSIRTVPISDNIMDVLGQAYVNDAYVLDTQRNTWSLGRWRIASRQFLRNVISLKEYPKVCVNLRSDVRYTHTVWRFISYQEKMTAHKKQQ